MNTCLKIVFFLFLKEPGTCNYQRRNNDGARKNDGMQHICGRFCSLRIVPGKIQNNILKPSSVCGVKMKRLV